MRTNEENILLFKVTSVFNRNFNAKTTIVLNEGGARSSKSYSICQFLIYKMLTETGKKILITRKTFPSLRITAYKLFIDLLNEYGIYKKSRHNKTLKTYEYNNNFILFTSIDDPTKIQSTEFNYIWMEEAEEFSFDDFTILKTRLSGKTTGDEINQIFLSYNPKQEQSYINKKVRYFEDVTLIKSTYKDNPMIGDDYIKIVESLKDQNEKLYKVFALGEYANVEGKIYTNIESIFGAYPENFDEVIYGLDFGFNNPTCLLKIGIKDKVYYVNELLYETKLTNSQLISRMKNLLNEKERKNYIYSDSAEPGRIEEIYRAGFNIKPSDKSVRDGIGYIQSSKIFTNPANVNFNNELEIYCYRKDKNGNYLDEPVKYIDHAMDAMRYAIYSHSRNKSKARIRVL
jgi:phage terminase large subunit